MGELKIMKQEIPQGVMIGAVVVIVLLIAGVFYWRLSQTSVERTPPPAGFGDPNKRFVPSPAAKL